ncbi:U3 snoRNP protein [Yamadazyma tenuis]|uniref:WD40 repeat-like protein n=1 Tax=Candida tenuis (strain ATCC 10573 / BCRC 21748 / CBS 615 / JCM 9827 / NBRC 10315 / NRRL Y-1498 / VKM Y-70) TaxID=590646 RepID=G3B1U1_CANTC|nr:WD40 repeat-like protein [Yamadazyma tenuis ATCC 10573]EGV64531.1 WD40 repeat-like protein [Yamadazyma tenuis ATCC 10573]WEJ97298.1 U3 snoRNP protein [Yamadazyma tenuis]
MSKNINSATMDLEIPPKDMEELQLEKLVFGDMENFQMNLKKTDNLLEYNTSDEELEGVDSDASKFYSGSDDENDRQDDDMFFIDDGENSNGVEGTVDMELDDSDDNESESEEDEEHAWSDSEDEKVSISLVASDKLKKLRKSTTDDYVNGKAYIKRLRTQFERIYPRPNWVEQIEEEQNGGEEGNEASDELTNNNTNALLSILKSTDKFTITKQLKLISPNKISVTRLKDGNHNRRSKSGIQSLSFHSKQPLLLTGGFDKTIRIYHIDGKSNTLVTSLHLKDSPIYSCSFSNLVTKDNKNLIYAAGRRKYMNKWDLNTGEVEKISRMYGFEKFQKSMEYFKVSPMGTFVGLTGSSGYCNILNGLSGQFLKNFKIEGTIIDFDFSHDEKIIIITNTVGEVWEFELETDKLMKRWQDNNGIGITKIKFGGPRDRWLAIGSNTGVVNLYDRLSSTPTIPFKAVENLVTTISSLQFNSDGQLLVIASRAKRDALRVVHLPSASVYSNWPTSGTPLGKVTSVTFSPNSQMLAVGNEAGKVTLWRLNHY